MSMIIFSPHILQFLILLFGFLFFKLLLFGLYYVFCFPNFVSFLLFFHYSKTKSNMLHQIWFDKSEMTEVGHTLFYIYLLILDFCQICFGFHFIILLHRKFQPHRLFLNDFSALIKLIYYCITFRILT